MTCEGKTVLVTGGTSGIGLATASAFAAAGANVVICGRDQEKGRRALATLAAGKGRHRFFPCDVSSPAAVRGLFDLIAAEYPALDYAVNCAGISNKGKLIIDFSESEFDLIMDINVKGVFLCLQEEIRLMLKNGKGAIVNVSSVLGMRANNTKNALYTASKHALTGLTKEAALEYAASGIRINAVMPAYTETDIIKDHLRDPEKRKAIERLHPIQRLIQPREVAAAVQFLCSDDASALTGVFLPVDGGCTAM